VLRVSKRLSCRRRVAWRAIDLLERPLAIEAPRSIDAYAIAVLEVDDFSRGGSPGLLL
jgi:hypothetical protein